MSQFHTETARVPGILTLSDGSEVAGAFFVAFLVTLTQDVVVRQDLTERTLMLLVASTQLGMFALLADMVDKRNP